MFQSTLCSKDPLVIEYTNLLPAPELKSINDQCSDRHWLAQHGVTVQLDSTGMSFELEDGVIPKLASVKESVLELLGSSRLNTFAMRVREYREGQSHSEHTDCFEIGEKHLLITALYCLSGAREGGHTVFVNRHDLDFDSVSNRLILWANYQSDGSQDGATMHRSTPVISGIKRVAIFLFYGEKSELPMLRERLLDNPAKASNI